MTVEELKQWKAESNLTSKELADYAEVPIGTLNKILNGQTKNPRYDTMRSLEQVLFQALDKKEELDPRIHITQIPTHLNYEYDMEKDEPCMVRETSTYQADEAVYTVDDYYKLPDDGRYELIDGKLYAMSAPSVLHQAILTELIFEFRKYIDQKRGNCKVYGAPCDVRLDQDHRTMVQPDLMICCRRDQITRKRIEGAPDLVIEIVSDSNSYIDYSKKLQKYCDAGVREYWIISPKKKRVLVYCFETSYEPESYSFEDEVPVGIYHGECRISFSEIQKRLDYIL